MIPLFQIVTWEDLNPRMPQYPEGNLTPPTVSMHAKMHSSDQPAPPPRQAPPEIRAGVARFVGDL